MNNPTVALKTSTCLGIIYNTETIRYFNNSASNAGHNAQLLLSQITYIVFHNLSSSFSLVLIQIIYFNIAFTIAIMNMHQGLCQYSNHQTVLKRSQPRCVFFPSDTVKLLIKMCLKKCLSMFHSFRSCDINDNVYFVV